MEYTEKFKLKVLSDIDLLGITETSKKHGVARQTVYNWMEKAKEINKNVSLAQHVVALRQGKLNITSALGDIDEYTELLKEIGTLKERKRKVAAKAEANLMRVIDLLENHAELDKIHPKDLSKIMIDLNTIKKDLYEEPTVIIEYRNSWMNRVLQVLKDFMSDKQIIDFVEKMEIIEEATYEEV